jgi:hypothetical protein
MGASIWSAGGVNPGPANIIEIREEIVATAGQTVFNLTFGTQYVPGTNNLDVFRNGQLLYSGDYTETDYDTITLVSFAASVGDKMLFVIRDNIGITAVVDQQLRTDLANASNPVKGAAMVGNIPAGTIASTTVQGAVNEIVSDLAASSGSSLVGFLQSGTGATARTSQSKLRESVSVKDFGAVMDGTTDDSAAVNAAILAVGAAGGGIVDIPAGSIKLSNILVKRTVLLRGAGSVATTIVVTDTVNAAIKLQDYCGVEEVRFYYPNQVITGAPTVYPATITHDTTITPAYVTLRNIRFQGAYDAVILGNATYGIGEVLIEHLTGFPMHLGIKIDNNTDVVRINNVHFNPNVYASYNTTLLADVYQNATALTLLRCDATCVDSFLCYGYAIGILGDAGAPSGSINMAKFSNCQIDVCRNPLSIDSHQDGVLFDNCVFTTGGANYAGVTGTSIDIGDTTVTTPSTVFFNNCSFRSFYSEIAVITCNVVFTNCVFDNYNIVLGAYRALRIDATGVDLRLIGCTIDGKSRATTGGVVSSAASVNVTAIGTKFTGLTTADMALTNARLLVNGCQYSQGFSWNGVVGGEAGGTICTYQIPTAFGGAGPFVLSDRFLNQLPAVGSAKAWICTVAGTPGTWVSEGNL